MKWPVYTLLFQVTLPGTVGTVRSTTLHYEMTCVYVTVSGYIAWHGRYSAFDYAPLWNDLCIRYCFRLHCLAWSLQCVWLCSIMKWPVYTLLFQVTLWNDLCIRYCFRLHCLARSVQCVWLRLVHRVHAPHDQRGGRVSVSGVQLWLLSERHGVWWGDLHLRFV